MKPIAVKKLAEGPKFNPYECIMVTQGGRKLFRVWTPPDLAWGQYSLLTYRVHLVRSL